jgi:hypothetical protein
MQTALRFEKKPFASTILLWTRADKPRQQSLNYWKGPHSGIISASPGQDEYRQLHLAERSPGLWPATRGIETEIPVDRRVDGVAEVTFQTIFAPIRGRKQTAMAFADEVNVFRRTLLYAGPPRSTRWYEVGARDTQTGAGAFVLLRRREGVSTKRFRRFLDTEFVPALAASAALTELRTQVFMPWFRQLWDTPNVAHDNPADQRFHASVVLGFADQRRLREFFAGPTPSELGHRLPDFVSAVHAYELAAALTYKRDGVLLPPPEQQAASSSVNELQP